MEQLPDDNFDTHSIPLGSSQIEIIVVQILTQIWWFSHSSTFQNLIYQNQDKGKKCFITSAKTEKTSKALLACEVGKN